MLDNLYKLGADVTRIASKVTASSTRAYLNSLAPNEFEYYLLSLELLNSEGDIEDSLIFPVMPNSISESRNSLVNVKKTNNAIISITNKTFAPTNINIAGTFGRKIRILLNRGNLKEKYEAVNNYSSSFNEVNLNVKTGFGLTKLLEHIIKKSQKKEGYTLYLYNLALSNNYLVEVTDMSFSQSTENNMMWNYTINFTSLAKAEDVYPRGKDVLKKSINEQLAYNNINKAIYELSDIALGIRTKALKNGLIYV